MTTIIDGKPGEGECFRYLRYLLSWPATLAQWISEPRLKSCLPVNTKYAEFAGKVFETSIGRIVFNTCSSGGLSFHQQRNEPQAHASSGRRSLLKDTVLQMFRRLLIKSRITASNMRQFLV